LTFNPYSQRRRKNVPGKTATSLLRHAHSHHSSEKEFPMTAQLAGIGILGLTCLPLLPAQDASHTHFRVNVDMVVLTFTVTDAKGNYVSGLKPEDFSIREDGIPQKIVEFAEGSKSSVQVGDVHSDALDGTKIFILFDTSNWMYTGFPYASDAIAEFVRRLDNMDSIAVYKFSRNLFRSVSLTRNRDQALSGVRSAVAGDDTAVYNNLLLTLRDAAKATGRKAVVVFSNGPDNASIVAPDDVAAVAEDEGIPVYIVSTCEAQKDQISANVFKRLTARTGGQLFWAQTWQKQAEAFTSIREDLTSSYSVAYYPAPSSNEGFRTISVNVISHPGKNYRVRTRLGYHAHRH
jgi:VWFA-related protein